MKLDILKNNYCFTLEDLIYEYNWEEKVIKKGFYFNGGSIPRLAWSICHPLLQPYLAYFCKHDYHYSNKCPYPITRIESDQILLWDLCRHNKAFWISAYIAVRLFWKSHFKKDLPFKKTLQKLKEIYNTDY